MSINKKIQSGGLVTFDIQVDGKRLSDEVMILNIDIVQAVNSVSTAHITVLDGEASTEDFAQSSSANFVPGKKISIHLGYDSTNNLIFEGIITKQGLSINETEGSVLKVECMDESVKMTVGRKTRTFTERSDSDIMASIIGGYSGLTTNISSTSTIWPKQVQYYATDWDYILSLAQANGLLVTTINGKISVIRYDDNIGSVLDITFGDNLRYFNSELDALSQVNHVKASSWDYKTQSIILGEATSSTSGAGNLSSQKLSEVIGLDAYDLRTSSNLDQRELASWSKAQIVKNEYAKIRGVVGVQGDRVLIPGNYITLSGLGDRFNGDHFVSKVRHTVKDGDWISNVSFGMSEKWVTEKPNVMAPPAAGLLPGSRGLFNATVLKSHEDPDGQYRVKIKIPLIDDSDEGVWARMSNFYSSSGAGAFFFPEIGDEVVVGFLNEDPRYPIILGSLYSSSKLNPPKGWMPNENNSIKGIASKSNLKIQFDDENKVLTIATPNKNEIVISDKDKSISIVDENENKVILSSSGITLKSAKDIHIEADQSVNIKGNTGVFLASSGGDVTQNGMNIKSVADIQCEISAGMSTKIKGSAEMTLEAAMIMIN